jgi:hypothetical protein
MKHEEGCRLERLIAVADFINHAIPSLEEMHGALNRLSAAGLITTRRGACIVTDKARKPLAKVDAHCRKNVLAQ